jgi:arabinose-5-phosphate isomerase
MRKGNHLAKVSENMCVKDVLLAITRARCGSACVVNSSGRFVGIFTDGDLRRQLETGRDLLNRQVKQVMTRNPTTISADKLAAEAFRILRERKFDELPVVDRQGKLVGLLDVQDLLKAGLV